MAFQDTNAIVLRSANSGAGDVVINLPSSPGGHEADPVAFTKSDHTRSHVWVRRNAGPAESSPSSPEAPVNSSPVQKQTPTAISTVDSFPPAQGPLYQFDGAPQVADSIASPGNMDIIWYPDGQVVHVRLEPLPLTPLQQRRAQVGTQPWARGAGLPRQFEEIIPQHPISILERAGTRRSDGLPALSRQPGSGEISLITDHWLRMTERQKHRWNRLVREQFRNPDTGAVATSVEEALTNHEAFIDLGDQRRPLNVSDSVVTKSSAASTGMIVRGIVAIAVVPRGLVVDQERLSLLRLQSQLMTIPSLQPPWKRLPRTQLQLLWKCLSRSAPQRQKKHLLRTRPQLPRVDRKHAPTPPGYGPVRAAIQALAARADIDAIFRVHHSPQHRVEEPAVPATGPELQSPSEQPVGEPAEPITQPPVGQVSEEPAQPAAQQSPQQLSVHPSDAASQLPVESSSALSVESTYRRHLIGHSSQQTPDQASSRRPPGMLFSRDQIRARARQFTAVSSRHLESLRASLVEWENVAVVIQHAYDDIGDLLASREELISRTDEEVRSRLADAEREVSARLAVVSQSATAIPDNPTPNAPRPPAPDPVVPVIDRPASSPARPTSGVSQRAPEPAVHDNSLLRGMHEQREQRRASAGGQSLQRDQPPTRAHGDDVDQPRPPPALDIHSVECITVPHDEIIHMRAASRMVEHTSW
ncbi:hypothetical protein N8I77_002139 [Diaporthe amygdali]|uniref:Uncharacterized protein n=1 Tax=Phomopsis amygdali TaxID=1214568 RepID=A0AAD9WA32_PHOAM|nr:hypothetical protein N8I77_002139 [Diaporthe amygdali]